MGVIHRGIGSVGVIHLRQLGAVNLDAALEFC